jgi:hypothetical protein
MPLPIIVGLLEMVSDGIEERYSYHDLEDMFISASRLLRHLDGCHQDNSFWFRRRDVILMGISARSPVWQSMMDIVLVNVQDVVATMAYFTANTTETPAEIALETTEEETT